ncbi:Uu.00g143780.m01.CDS01 [Anthostomella pinea]|uniref:Uu.00g143780.m01.CDS01 n=1 Tax=Anthostomella pinea TaxID=933095 RepID=A0AAI8VQR4_9PEZI|nr:Uu.00g143780.m01.CDS01 [Anthostomella pinea]
MRVSIYTLVSAALSAGPVSAFPAHLAETFSKLRSASDIRSEPNGIPSCPFAKRQLPGVDPPFDAETQYVSNTGDHAFVAPSSNDQRGPCPGLNAMANHGYLPHNGVASIQEFITGTMEAFGMGIDLATFLAIYGAVLDGDLTSYSIGGPVPSLLKLGGLLGEPQGLSGSHNKYEGDASPVHGDFGNNLPQVSQFTALYELGQANSDSIDLELLTQFRVQRFSDSISQNPYFFSAPFSGLIVSNAAYTFIYRFMANKTAENPQGILNGEILKSFYAVTGEFPDFTITPGHEHFPDNWYKRNPLDYYTIPYFNLDALAMQLEHPQFLSVGGNTGKVNSFVGVDPAALTDGVFNAPNLLEGNNAFCFGVQGALQMAPDILKGLFGDITEALVLLSSAVGNATQGLSCPQLTNFDEGQFAQFPGYTGLKPDGEYKA